MTKDYLKRQFSNFYNEVIKGKFANLNTDDVGIASAQIIYDINHISIGSNVSDYASLVDGVYTFNAPIGSSRYSQYKIKDSDIKGGVCTVKINVTEISGSWAIQKVFFDTSGTRRAENVITIKDIGEYSVTVDLDHETVYNNYRGDGLFINVANISSSTSEVTYTIKIDKYDTVLGDGQTIEGGNLTEVLQGINAKINTTISGNSSSELVAPNGNKYITQLKADGSLVAIPKLPSNILYIGNSLLIGFGTHGMASTTVNDDYYAKVNAYLESKGKTVVTDKISGVDLEHASTDTEVNTWLTESLSAKMSNDRQLVLIQLGDNAGTTIEEFRKSCGMLISYVRENCPNARVVWVGMWYSSQDKLDIVTENCNKYGITFIDIHDLATKTENKSTIGAKYIDENGVEQTISQSGVANHPSDAGFTAIANRIITTLFE